MEENTIVTNGAQTGTEGTGVPGVTGNGNGEGQSAGNMSMKYKFDVLSVLKELEYTTYKICKEKLLSESTVQKLRNSQPVSWKNIESLCKMLKCQPGDLLECVLDLYYVRHQDDLFSVEFDKKENIAAVKRCGKDWHERDIDATIDVEELIKLLVR